MRDRRDLRNVQHFEPGIADGLADHELGVRPDRRSERVEIARLDEGRGDAEARQRVRQKVDGAAIERARRHDVVAGVQERRDGQMQRGHAARGADRADAAFQCREPLLQYARGRIGDARIDVAGALQIEQRGRVIGILKHVGRGLVDRHRAGAGRGIRMLARMQAQGFERRRFRRGHAWPRWSLIISARFPQIGGHVSYWQDIPGSLPRVVHLSRLRESAEQASPQAPRGIYCESQPSPQAGEGAHRPLATIEPNLIMLEGRASLTPTVAPPACPAPRLRSRTSAAARRGRRSAPSSSARPRRCRRSGP